MHPTIKRLYTESGPSKERPADDESMAGDES